MNEFTISLYLTLIIWSWAFLLSHQLKEKLDKFHLVISAILLPLIFILSEYLIRR